MCGILGTNFETASFNKALEHLNNRGPDYSCFKTVNNKMFGHTRLAIIDLDEEANQPMIFDNILIVFNGEIYNFRMLKKEYHRLLRRQLKKAEIDFLNNPEHNTVDINYYKNAIDLMEKKISGELNYYIFSHSLHFKMKTKAYF